MLKRERRHVGRAVPARLAAALATAVFAGAAAHAQPVNDECSGAVELTLGVPYAGTQEGTVATPTGTQVSTCGTGTYTRTTHYTFTPSAASTRYRVRLFDNVNAGGILSIHTGCPDMGGAQVACHGPTGVVDEYVDFESDAIASPVVVIHSTLACCGDDPYMIVIEESPPVPPHNDCSMPMPISLGEVITDDNTGSVLTPAAVSNLCIISDGGLNVLWYTFTPPQPNRMYRVRGVTLTPNGSPFISTHSLVLAPFTSCGLPAGDELFCSDNGRDTFADFRSDALASPVLIHVGTRSFYETQYEVWVEEAPTPPDNAECIDASPIGLNQVLFGTTAGSLQAVDIDSCGLAGTDNRRTAWYAFTPPDPDTDYTIETFGAAANVTLSAWMDCSGSPAAEIGCSDVQSTNDTRLDVTSDAAASTILIRVASQSTAEATFDVSVIETVPVPGDICGDAIEIASLPYTSLEYDTASYIATTPKPSCHQFSLFLTDTANSLWHTITPAADVTVRFEGTALFYQDISMMLYTGVCGAVTEIDCVIGDNAPAVLEAALSAGTTYYIVEGDAGLPGLTTGGITTLTATEVTPPACACEFDGAAGVDVFDLLAYLDLWFPSDAGADLDGAAGVDVFDLLFFLDCWFPASAGSPCP